MHIVARQEEVSEHAKGAMVVELSILLAALLEEGAMLSTTSPFQLDLHRHLDPPSPSRSSSRNIPEIGALSEDGRSGADHADSPC